MIEMGKLKLWSWMGFNLLLDNLFIYLSARIAIEQKTLPNDKILWWVPHIGVKIVLISHLNFLKLGKGQLISKQIYEVIVLPKIRTKYCKDFCPSIQGRNPCNISFVFWAKRWLHKIVLRFTDLYLLLNTNAPSF